MKSRIFNFVIAVAIFSLLIVGTASAQLKWGVKAKIPFDFIVGNQVMPAGNYTIQRGLPNDGYLISIQNDDNSSHAFVDVNGAYQPDASDNTELTFDHIGDKYFLRNLWFSGENAGCEVPKSREERNLLRSEDTLSQAVTITAGLTAQR